MSHVLVIVASDTPLTAGHLAEIEGQATRSGITIAGTPGWLRPHHAAEIPIAGKADMTQILALRHCLAKNKIDIFCVPEKKRRKKLLLADMDSTIVTTETLDEIAAFAGLKEKVAVITEQAMRGEIDFKGALKERVAMLTGLPEDTLQKVLAQIELTPGADILVPVMAQAGATCVLVSGGFTTFTSRIAKKAGFAHHHGNVLEIKDGKLTGTVADPILDKEEKCRLLDDYRKKLGISVADTMAIGDGANDLPMLLEAGLGIGFHPKPVLRESLENCIIHGDLTAALYIQGYRHEEAGA